MTKAKKHRAHKVRAMVKKIINPKDQRIEKKKALPKDEGRRNIENVPVSMFFAHNSALGPPYHVNDGLPFGEMYSCNT